MNKDEILKYLEKNLIDETDYNFLVIDAREKKPRLFKAWWIEASKTFGIRA